jgi:iron complex outermembrane recepter protein
MVHHTLFKYHVMRKITLLVAVSVIAGFTGFGQTTTAKSDTTVTDTILPFQQQQLKEVKVVAKKKLVEQKIDKMVINVDAAVTNAGTTAMDVLEKSPGVQVDKDGNISLKGKQGVMVMLDGRPTYLSGTELANLLRGMESSQIEQIEIMTNPPAKYDAAGNSGVINIKTKKNKLKGFNGSASATIGQGKYSKMNESVSLNYRNNKINLFGNFSHGRYNNFNQLDIFRRYKNEDETTRAIFEQVAFNRNTWNNHNAKIGMDYYLSKKTTIGFVASGFTNPSTQRGINKSFLKSPLSTTDSIVESRSNTNQRWSNGAINLNMRHAYDSTGRELTADIDVVKYDVTNTQDFSNVSFTPTMVKQFEENLRGDIPMKISIYSAKMDYIRPLKKDGKIEMGWKSSYVENDSRANYFNIIEEESHADYTKTNYFRYKENINAAYINFNKKLSKKFEMQSGLRFENTNYSGLQWGNPNQNDSSFNKSYNGLFPTVYLKYSADKNNQIGLSLGRRIERPRYEDLNPFMFFIDKYTYGRGNPYLKPQYSNNIELTHTFKGFLTTTLNYSETKNMFAEIFDQEGSYATIVTQGNIGKRRNMGISMSSQIPVAKWWNSNVYANYNYEKLNGKLTGEDFEVSSGNFTINVNNQLTFKKGWSAEVSGWYRSRGIWGQIRSYPMGALTTGVSKQVLKGKGSVKMSVRDIFYTQPARGDINFKSTEARFRSHWDSRQVNLTLTYRFGKPFKVEGPQRRERTPEEQNRVKGGSN